MVLSPHFMEYRKQRYDVRNMNNKYRRQKNDNFSNFYCNFIQFGSRDSSAGIETGYGPDNRGSIPDEGQEIFFLLHSIQTGSGAHQSPIHWVTKAVSPGVKLQ
jgi:hypothetical protein